MYKKVTILFFTLLCSAALAFGQSVPSHGPNDPSKETKEKEKVLKIFPNPATTQINFEVQGNNEGTYEIIIYNFLGKRINDLKNINNRTTLDLSRYYSGIYIYQLRDAKGTLVESGKFNVIRQ